MTPPLPWVTEIPWETQIFLLCMEYANVIHNRFIYQLWQEYLNISLQQMIFCKRIMICVLDHHSSLDHAILTPSGNARPKWHTVLGRGICHLPMDLISDKNRAQQHIPPRQPQHATQTTEPAEHTGVDRGGSACASGQCQPPPLPMWSGKSMGHGQCQALELLLSPKGQSYS